MLPIWKSNQKKRRRTRHLGVSVLRIDGARRAQAKVLHRRQRRTVPNQSSGAESSRSSSPKLNSETPQPAYGLVTFGAICDVTFRKKCRNGIPPRSRTDPISKLHLKPRWVSICSTASVRWRRRLAESSLWLRSRDPYPKRDAPDVRVRTR